MFLALVHVCGGSQAEATQSDAVMGPFSTRPEAVKAENDLYAAVRHIPTLRDEMVCNIVEVPDQSVTVADVAVYLQKQYGD